jgi:L-seryl-tRNA(Ser) seleniumtransferase
MNKNEQLRKLPGIDSLLEELQLKNLCDKYSQELVTYCARKTLNEARNDIKNIPTKETLISDIIKAISKVVDGQLKPVINATGIVLHTNLGRAPLGTLCSEDITKATAGYSNLEYNLEDAYRGQRTSHIVEILKFLTTAENVIVVNNNAAAVMLALNTLVANKEVIISRGELIEIGGSFRIPDIMAASGSKMIEVGTTNKTHIADYENAITENTAMLFKAHKSNFSLNGFTKEISVKELAALGKKYNIPVVYDLGSGLLRKPDGLPLDSEPDVRQMIADGADIVTFSGDKLLGGPQAGIIAGKKELIQKLAKAPMMRALRVGKITIAGLSSVCRSYLNDTSLIKNNPCFKLLNRKQPELKLLAESLQHHLKESGLKSEMIQSDGQCGGGTLPDLRIKSYAVIIDFELENKKDAAKLSEHIFKHLLLSSSPILGILRQGKLVFDVLTLFDEDLSCIANQVAKLARK